MALKPKDAPDLSRFDWEDAFRLNDQLTEDERMMRDAARAYATEKLIPRVTQAYREEATDPAIFREMGEMGLLGITVPEEYGGLGASYVAYGLVAREVERVDSGYRSMMSVAKLARHVSDLCLRVRRSAQEIPAETGLGRVHRLLRPH